MATIDPSKLADGVQDTLKISVSPETEQAIQNAEGKDLEQQRFDLQLKIEEQNLKHKGADFKPSLDQKQKDFNLTYRLKIGVAFVSLIYLSFTSFLILKIAYCYADSPNWHLPLAIVVGSFTSNFAIIALLLKGIFSQDKPSANASIPISLGEMVKTIATAWRSNNTK